MGVTKAIALSLALWLVSLTPVGATEARQFNLADCPYAALASQIDAIARGTYVNRELPPIEPETVRTERDLLDGDASYLPNVHDPSHWSSLGIGLVPHFVRRIAEKRNISVDEAYALARNFFRPDQLGPGGELKAEHLFDGALGVRRANGYHTNDADAPYVIDFNDGVFAGYRRWFDRLDLKRGLTGDQLFDMAPDMHRETTTSDRGGDKGGPARWQTVRKLIGLRPSGKKTSVDGEINDYVKSRMDHYGIKYRVVEGPGGKKRTMIEYPEYKDADRSAADGATRRRHPKGALDQLAADINAMVAAGVAPEVVVARAVQDYLIIHGASGHNGRTARVLGQILYRKLTGKDLVFPPEFHKELDYSDKQLAESLFAKKKPDEPYVLPSVRQLGRHLFLHDGVTPRRPDAGGTKPTNDEPIPFGDFSFTGQESRIMGIGNYRTFDVKNYRDLPAAVRLRGGSSAEGNLLFYGRPLKGIKVDSALTGKARDDAAIEAATPNLMQFFAHGRKPGEHNRDNSNIYEHQTTTGRGGYNSRFGQSTKDITIARRFALDPPEAKEAEYGVIFVLDPRLRNPKDPSSGPQVLDINAFYEWADANRDKFPGLGRTLNHSPHEKEVLWANIPPGDIVGAYIVRRDPVGRENRKLNGTEENSNVVGFIRNPHYVSRDGAE